MGPISGANIYASIETAKELGPGHTIVTVLYDSGDRYSSTFYDEKWLKSKKLEVFQKDTWQIDHCVLEYKNIYYIKFFVKIDRETLYEKPCIFYSNL